MRSARNRAGDDAQMGRQASIRRLFTSDGSARLGRLRVSRERKPRASMGFGAGLQRAMEARKEPLIHRGHATRMAAGSATPQHEFALFQRRLKRAEEGISAWQASRTGSR